MKTGSYRVIESSSHRVTGVDFAPCEFGRSPMPAVVGIIGRGPVAVPRTARLADVDFDLRRAATSSAVKGPLGRLSRSGFLCPTASCAAYLCLVVGLVVGGMTGCRSVPRECNLERIRLAHADLKEALEQHPALIMDMLKTITTLEQEAGGYR